MYEFADTVGNILQSICEMFSSPMSTPRILTLLLCVLAVILLFQFKWTRRIMLIAIVLSLMAVIFALVYGFLYALSGDGIIQLIVAVVLLGALAGPAYIIIKIFW